MRHMRLLIVVSVILLTSCVSTAGTKAAGTAAGPSIPAEDGDTTTLLRLVMLRNAPIEETGDEPALMLMDMPGGTASLFAANSGDASIYYNKSGGAIIGGGGHAHIHAAAIALLHEAKKHKPAMSPVTAFPLPGDGTVRFYVRTPLRVYMAEASLEDLLNDRSPFASLFAAGMDVLLPLAELDPELNHEKPPG